METTPLEEDVFLPYAIFRLGSLTEEKYDQMWQLKPDNMLEI